MKKAINIKWDTDGQSVDLPKEVELPEGIANCECADLNCENNAESVNNYLSDKYGWLVEDYNIICEGVSFGELPMEIRQKVYDALTKDILERYDNSAYHNEDVIHNTLAELGYKLAE